MSTLRNVLLEHKSDVALVVGNGVNRYRHTGGQQNDWRSLLSTLAKKHISDLEIPKNLALTEFYDILSLKADGTVAQKLQQEFCALINHWEPFDQHKRVAQWALAANVPILTTNFDDTLAMAVNAKLFSTFKRRSSVTRPTDYYPWESYYGHTQWVGACDGFGIWHINGMKHYPRSLRLGLTHYMGSMARARSWIYQGKETRLFDQHHLETWRGANTWLHSVFTRSLVVVGLGLEESEVFLRWLLIVRAMMFKKYKTRAKPGWFVYTTSDFGNADHTKRMSYYLKAVGITPVKAADYDEIYSRATWQC